MFDKNFQNAYCLQKKYSINLSSFPFHPIFYRPIICISLGSLFLEKINPAGNGNNKHCKGYFPMGFSIFIELHPIAGKIFKTFP